MKLNVQSYCFLFQATNNYGSTYELIQEHLHSRIQKDDLLGINDEDKAVKSNEINSLPNVSNLEFFQCTGISCNPSPFSLKKYVILLLF